MKAIILIFALFPIASCKQQIDNSKISEEIIGIEEEAIPTNVPDSMYFIFKKIQEEQLRSQRLKKEGLIGTENILPALKELVASKSIYKESDDYLLDYTYPYLNERIDSSFRTFNEFFAKNYLNTERTINDILEDYEIICDTLSIPRFRDQRIINYKLKSAHNDLISILLYKENYYSGMLHSTYMFDCLNYDSKNQEFIYFDTFFIEGSEKMVHDLINKTILDQSYPSGDYADCWQLSLDDFIIYKNNFVITNNHIVFYLDDCIICPYYTGAYKVAIPINKLNHLIRTHHKSLLL
ncbi:RsiV family protein [Nonlabens sp.]|uniref:RsiV family protein n=1 Tax=Nonlabens sp. TaxID=1888209 RepID=UPI001BD08413|nr:RsiV family protein [Nonlabens sp.]